MGRAIFPTLFCCDYCRAPLLQSLVCLRTEEFSWIGNILSLSKGSEERTEEPPGFLVTFWVRRFRSLFRTIQPRTMWLQTMLFVTPSYSFGLAHSNMAEVSTSIPPSWRYYITSLWHCFIRPTAIIYKFLASLMIYAKQNIITHAYMYLYLRALILKHIHYLF